MEFALVSCVCTKDIASKIAQQLMEERLAASIDILPGTWGGVGWEPKHVGNDEVTLLITSVYDLTEDIYGTILAMHPASIAVISDLEINESYSGYLSWVVAQLQGA